MYNFRVESDLCQFDKFAENNCASLMQTSMWANTRRMRKSYFYSGFDSNNNRVLTMAANEQKINGKIIWCAPCGMVCDYSNSQLIYEFSDFIKKEMNKFGACALVIDPYIKTTDSLSHIANDVLLENGYVYNKNKDDYTIQPCGTLLLKLTDENGKRYTEQSLIKKFEKGVRYSVRVGEERGLETESYLSDTLDDEKAKKFYDIMLETADRVDFSAPREDYYKFFMQCFGKYAVMDFVSYSKEKDKLENDKRVRELTVLEAELDSLPKNKKSAAKAEISRLQTAINAYEQRKKEAEGLNEKEYLACGLSVRFGSVATCVYGGTKNILRNALRCSHYVNFKRICDSIEAGCDYHDMGRLPVGAQKEGHRYNGLFNFKSSFNTDYVEYIGEYCLVSNKLAYTMCTKILPKIKSIVKPGKKLRNNK